MTFWSCDAIGTVLASHDVNGMKMVPLHSLHQENQNEMKRDFSVI